jgi:hypothetical protein
MTGESMFRAACRVLYQAALRVDVHDGHVTIHLDPSGDAPR